MARPLREQFLVATLVLIVPVIVIMVLFGQQTYRDQLVLLGEDAYLMAATVAAHIDQHEGDDDVAGLAEFLPRIPLPAGSTLVVADETGRVVARHGQPTSGIEERWPGQASAATRPWTITVALPTELAWGRAMESYRRTIFISGLATLVLLLLQFLFLRRWLPALEALGRTADRVGAGDLGPVPPRRMPAQEMARLHEAFAEMVEKLREARERIDAQIAEERRMRGELQSLQQQVIRQERLAAIGVLLSGIAHELNNPLQAIAGFADLLQRDPDLKASVRTDLELIQKESARAGSIIRNLSRFGRQQGTEPSIVLMPEVIASVVELRQRRLVEQNIALDVDERSTHLARAIFSELQQVVLNFVINAEQAIAECRPPVRRITIRTQDVGSRLRVEVEDTGPGVALADESKLFQPFFTTKPVGEGTGLGLSVSYGIIRSLGGEIGYRRGAEGGALFFFELPAIDPAGASE
ncbi:MAG TPA: ATP-binding protein [Vicinamibacterales bacterium]|nr:ATP-binding protein [Vicinamibacterales bacterium]